MDAVAQFEIDIFYGAVSQNCARVYAQVNALAGGGDWTLSGSVRGPHSQFSHTLAASFALNDLGSGPSVLAEALVFEPCFWSPRLPALYDVRIELSLCGVVQQTVDQTIGIRFFGSRGRSLVLDGQRWVLRGIHAAAAPQSDFPVWREVSAAMVVDDPSDEQCRIASQQGVLLVARLTSINSVQQQLRRLGTWAAAAIVIPPAEFSESAIRCPVAPNLILAQWHAGQRGPVIPAPWARLMFCEVAEPQRFHELGESCPLPIVAVRRLNEVRSLAAARRACDELQRDLAPSGDYAGYVV